MFPTHSPYSGVLSYVALEPLIVFLIALGAALLIRGIAGGTSRSQSRLVRLAVGLCIAGALAVLMLLACFAIGTPMTVQEKIAIAALLMSMLGGILFASVYRSEGDDPPPPDEGPGPPPDDDPGGDHAYPWWPEFERKLRDFERERERERPKTFA
jgi:hypothetical protein